MLVQLAVDRDEDSLASDGDAMGVKSALLSRLLHAAAASQVTCLRNPSLCSIGSWRCMVVIRIWSSMLCMATRAYIKVADYRQWQLPPKGLCTCIKKQLV